VRRRLAALAVGSGAALVIMSAPAGAHGIGGRSDLPLPVWMFAYGAAAALVISFLALRLLWQTARLTRAAIGRLVGRPADAALGIGSVVLRVLGLALFALTLAAAWVGTEDSSRNLAPVVVYVVLWVGMALLSAVLGDWWRALSPFDTIAAVATAARRRAWPGPAGEHPDDDSLVYSHWPAALGLVSFVWLELCYHSRAEPRILAWIITGYSLVVLAAVARFGRGWLRTGEFLAVLFGLLATMAPLFRDHDGRVRVRWPFSGLATVTPRRGTVAFICIALGSTTFDGVSRTRFWSDVQGTSTGWARTGIDTVGLLWVIGIVLAVYVLAAMAAGRIGGTDRDEGPRRYVHSLVPIALAYAIAHYFSLFVIEGQSFVTLLSDPFGRGWNLFGTATRLIDFTVVTPRQIAWVQAGAIVVGHVAGVAVAHDRAVETMSPERATRSQYPLLVAMIAYTAGGLFLLMSS